MALGPKQVEAMMRMSQMLKMHTITMTSGDLKTGMTASGMSVGLVHDVPTISELIQRIVTEMETAKAALDRQLNAAPQRASPQAAAID
jgi:hypothetical protein